MSLVTKNGTVRHHSLPTKLATPYSDYGYNDTYICRVDEVIYADNPENTGNKCPSQKANLQLQYNVTVLEGPKAGSQIFAVRDGETRGDGNNYQLRVRRATTAKSKGPEADSPIQTDGEYVLVTFVGGSPTAPIITGTLPHPKHIGIVPKTPSDPDSDVTEVKEVNGTRITYYASGKYVVENMGGPKDNEGNYTNDSASGTKTEVDKDGNITVTTGGTTPTTVTIKKDGSHKIEGQSHEVKAETNVKIKSSGTSEFKSTGVTDVDGSLIKVGGGGPSAARIGDMVISEGTDSNGDSHCLIGKIIGGSTLNLIGG